MKGATNAAPFVAARHITLVCTRATAANLRASSGCVPVADCTIHRAWVRIALPLLAQRGARVSTVLCMRVHRACARLLTARAARLGARAPRLPRGDQAVLRAVAHVAGPRLLRCTARHATVLVIPKHGAVTPLHPGTASRRARLPRTPLSHAAVHRATLGVARLRLRQRRANEPAVRALCRDTAHSRARAAPEPSSG